MLLADRGYDADWIRGVCHQGRDREVCLAPRLSSYSKPPASPDRASVAGAGNRDDGWHPRRVRHGKDLQCMIVALDDPLSERRKHNAVPTCSAIAASTRICASFAEAQSRDARLTTLPMAV